MHQSQRLAHVLPHYHRLIQSRRNDDTKSPSSAKRTLVSTIKCDARFGRNPRLNGIGTIVNGIRQSRFARDSAILTVGTLTAQLIGLVAIPILSRLYSPSQFGQLAIFFAVVSIIATMITLRYEVAIFLPKQEGEAISITVLSLVLALSLGTVFSVLSWIGPTDLKESLGVSSIAEWLPMAVMTGIATAAISIAMNFLNRRRAYAAIAKYRVSQSLCAACLGIVLGFIGYSGGLIFAQFIALIVVASTAIAQIRPELTNWTRESLVCASRKYSSSPKFLLPTSLMDVATLQLPVFFIATWFNTELAGQFNMAWRIITIPITFIGVSIGQVFIQRFSQSWPDERAARKLMYKTWTALALIGALPTLAVMIFGQRIFSFFLGSSWNEAGSIAEVLAPMILAMLISSPTSGSYIALGLQRYSLYFGTASVIHRTACLYWGAATGDLLAGLFAWTVCEITAICVYNLIALRAIRLHELNRN